MPSIRRLSETTVNRIAAGEVIERPAAALKELVENAVDAGATRIDVTMAAGGAQLIRVVDNGAGMAPEDLKLCVERHATSKLPNEDDLLNIEHLGFRGEALPSIGAVSRLSLTSRPLGAREAWSIRVDGGHIAPPEPAAQAPGTCVEVRDLFFATPARLKFLKSERAEQMAATDMIKRLAMAHCEITFSLSASTSVSEQPKRLLQAEASGTDDAQLSRLGQIMGREFPDNALPIDVEREGIRLTGYIGLPTLNKRTAQSQFLFVNGRPVQDKLFKGAIRGGYQDVLAHDRHAVVALYLDVPPHLVDVNVHPAKAEVRFRDAGLVRGMIVSSLKQALTDAGHRTSTTVSLQALGKMRPEAGWAPAPGTSGHTQQGSQQRSLGLYAHRPTSSVVPRGLSEAAMAFHQPVHTTTPTGMTTEATAAISTDDASDTGTPAHPLGTARAQLHQTYIVSQTPDGLVLVDQHAAHERLTLERLRKQVEDRGIARQILLIPDVVEMDVDAAQRLVDRSQELEKLGLLIEAFGPGAIMVRETPALLGTIDAHGLLRDLSEDLVAWDAATSLVEHVDHVLATMACHGSIRAGRQMTPPEMDALLRDMEATPLSGQCAHGRPTYVELKLSDIERLFGRKE